MNLFTLVIPLPLPHPNNEKMSLFVESLSRMEVTSIWSRLKGEGIKLNLASLSISPRNNASFRSSVLQAKSKL